MHPLLALAPLLAFISLIAQAALATHAPLYRRFTSSLTPSQRLERLNEQQRSTRRKYGLAGAEDWMRVEGGDLRKRQDNGEGSERLAGVQGLYLALITLGTPPVDYSVLLDTGSSELVLLTPQSATASASNNSAEQPCSPRCTPAESALYSPEASSSSEIASRQPVQITYGTGRARGILVEDRMGFAGFSALQTFIAATSATELTATPSQAGLLGLGWRGLSASGSTPFVQELFEGGELQDPVMGFGLRELGGEGNASEIVAGGLFSLSTLPTNLFTEPINYIPLSSASSTTSANEGDAPQPGYWSIPLSSISINGQVVPSQLFEGGAQATVIDTGTNSIAIPSRVASLIYSQVPGAQLIPGSEGLWAFECSSNVSLVLTFGGQVYELASDAFNLGIVGRSFDGEDLCAGAVTSLGSDTGDREVWIIGTPFLASFYSIFRFSPPSVGFARLTDDAQEILAEGGLPRPNGGQGEGNVSGAERSNIVSVCWILGVLTAAGWWMGCGAAQIALRAPN